MIEWFTWVQVAVAVAAGLFCVIRGLVGRAPNDLTLGSAALVELLLRLEHVHRDAHRAGLVGERAADRVADPPARVGREAQAAAVVEASYDGQHYHVAALRSVDIMLARQAVAMHLPSQPPSWIEFELSNEQAREAVADPRPQRLSQWGVPASSAAAFAQALQPGQSRASVQVMPVVYGRVGTVQRVRVLYADPIGTMPGEHAAWLAVPVIGGRVRLIPASIGHLAEAVRTFLPQASSVHHG